MAPTDTPPFSPTERVDVGRAGGSGHPDPGPSSGGGWLPMALLLLSVTLISAGVGFVLSGGQLPGIPDPTPVSQPVAQAQSTPPPAPATSVAAPPTAGPPATAAPVQATVTVPVVAPTEPPAPATPPPAPTQVPATAVPKPTTAPPPPPPVVATATAAPKPNAARPAADPRLPQIERRVRDYFAALRAEDFARAQQVCCSEAWRARYPLDRWERNFDGVTELRMEGEPRYLLIEPGIIQLDTDYTFLSAGQRRHFTIRWTFAPNGDQWEADIAEAFAR